VALLRTEVSEELRTSIIRLTRIGELRTTLAVTTTNVIPSSSVLVTLMMEVVNPSETSVLTRATRRNILEGGFLHSDRREYFKSYIEFTG
jgi:hypothetical protein